MIKLQFKRGLKANLPTLSSAEPAYVTDEKRLYIGSGTDNIPLATPYHGRATLAVASWVGSAAPFVYTIAVADMTDDDNTGVGVAYSADEAANAVLDKAWQAAKPRIESVAGQLKIIARGTKPTVAIPIFYRGSR